MNKVNGIKMNLVMDIVDVSLLLVWGRLALLHMSNSSQTCSNERKLLAPLAITYSC